MCTSESISKYCLAVTLSIPYLSVVVSCRTLSPQSCKGLRTHVTWCTWIAIWSWDGIFPQGQIGRDLFLLYSEAWDVGCLVGSSGHISPNQFSTIAGASDIGNTLVRPVLCLWHTNSSVSSWLECFHLTKDSGFKLRGIGVNFSGLWRSA